jgi:hypothetical protein
MAITTPPMGIGEAFGFGFETTFGTAAAQNVWWRPISNTLRRSDPVRPLSGPSGGMMDTTTTRGFRGKPDISGTVVVEADYNYIGYLLSNAIATPTFSDDDPVVDAFTHTFTLAAGITGTTPASFSAARVTDTSNLDSEFTGCMINAIEISAAQDRIVTVSLDIIAQGGAAAHTTESIGTLSADPFIEFHDTYVRADRASTGQTLDSGDNLDGTSAVPDWTWRLDNNYRRQQAAGDGVRGDREYTFSGYRTSTLTLSRDFADGNYFDKYHESLLVSTFGTFGVYCQSDEFTDGAGGATPFSLAITFSAGQVQEAVQPYPGGPDILNENIVIKAGYNGSDAPVVATLINDSENAASSPYVYIAP